MNDKNIKTAQKILLIQETAEKLSKEASPKARRDAAIGLLYDIDETATVEWVVWAAKKILEGSLGPLGKDGVHVPCRACKGKPGKDGFLPDCHFCDGCGDEWVHSD